MNNYLPFARFVASKEFANKTDKAGRPYIEHLEAVTATVESDDDEVKAIAMLHDLVEDCHDWTIERVARDFSPRIADALNFLTREGQPYDLYISNIKKNPDAVLVKLADLRHNMDVSRLPYLGDYEIRLMRKYHAAYLELKQLSTSGGGEKYLSEARTNAVS